MTNNFFQPGQNYSKMYEIEPSFNEIVITMNTIHISKGKKYLGITSKRQSVITDECQTDQRG